VDESFDKNDLKFNVPFGDFDESQSYAMLELIAQHLPKVHSRCQTEVLLPEALIYLCCHQLNMTYDQAEAFLRIGGQQELGDFMAQLKQKADKKRKHYAQDGEVRFIKCR